MTDFGDWKTLFKNEDEIICPITDCKVLNVGCKEDLVLSRIKVKEVSNIYFGSTLVDEGWDEKVCIQCKNGEGA